LYKYSLIFAFAIFSSLRFSYSQDDTVYAYLEKNAAKVDSMGLIVKNIVISGNDVTDNNVILREMSLKEGEPFTMKKYTDDLSRLNNLRLFSKVDILPIPISQNEVLLNVDVKERWYLYPLPSAGIDEGEWRKLWVSLNLRWDNFRGKDESVNLNVRFFYNPSVRFSYNVPWIGDNMHLFTNFSIGYSKMRNESLLILGKQNGEPTIGYYDTNFDYINFNTGITIGRYFNRNFSVFTNVAYTYLRTLEYFPGSTANPDGKDQFLSVGGGIQWDSRNNREFATLGYYMRTTFTRNGFNESLVDFNRFSFAGQGYVPVFFSKDYFITLASSLNTNLAVGYDIPVYSHQYLGYSSNYVRGWWGLAYEGEDLLTSFNEIRIPIITPSFIKANKVPIVQDLPIVKKMEFRYGLYGTVFFDAGAVFNHGEYIFKQHYQYGTGVGLNFIAPFGYIFRTEFAVRLAKPTIGQVNITFGAKF